MIRFGTASWTDPTLLASGRFYPPSATSAAARLAFYASQFSLVEVNASYYAIGDPMQAYRWVEGTPDPFRFHLKAFRLFTGHPTPVASLDNDIRRAIGVADGTRIFYTQTPPEIREELWRRFLESVEPLRMAGRLDAVHFQFPPWIRPHTGGLRLANEAVRRLTDHPVSMEWRHASWLTGSQRDATLAWQREHRVIHTIVDSPSEVDNTVPAVWEVTHPEMALVRMHGRNAAAWNAQTTASSGRFNYEYSAAELACMAQHIRTIAARAKHTHVILNTNYQDQGMRNAAALRQAVGSLL